MVIGPGDDLAEVLVTAPEASGGAGARILVGVDQVVDGLHVHADRVPWEAIGRKAVNRSLSDIAAMAGRPLAIVAAVTLPEDATQARVHDLCEGIAQAAQQGRAPLVGGDIAIHRQAGAPLTISVTVLGLPTAAGPVCRSGARVGDGLVMTGRLGGTHDDLGGGAHLDFTPRLGEGVLLHAILGDALHAMIDISDGLGRDAGNLVGASSGGLQARIDAALLPCRPGIDWTRAVGEGEDHELLMAVDPEAALPEAIGSPDAPCVVRRIGRFVERQDGDDRHVVVEDGGVEHDVSMAGWDHGS